LSVFLLETIPVHEKINTWIDSDKIKKIVLLGAGDSSALNLLSSQKLGGKLYAALSAQKVEKAKLHFSMDSGDAKHIIFNMMLGFLIRSYKFDKYFTKKNDDEPKIELNQIDVIWDDPHTTAIEFEKTNYTVRKISDCLQYAFVVNECH
jgi:leucyl aminopeptidase